MIEQVVQSVGVCSLPLTVMFGYFTARKSFKLYLLITIFLAISTIFLVQQFPNHLTQVILSFGINLGYQAGAQLGRAAQSLCQNPNTSRRNAQHKRDQTKPCLRYPLGEGDADDLPRNRSGKPN